VVWPAVFFQETDRVYALEVFAALQEMGDGTTLLVIGTGDYLPEIKARAAALGLHNVVFTGAVPYDQMPNYYASASAGFLPLRDNHYDACKGPIKLFEYMAMGLPVIATDVGEPREMVQKAGCGIVIPFGNPHQAASLVARLINSPEQLAACGARGRSYLTGRQSFAAQAEKLQRMLEKALSTQRRR
jgi:glycosyltransferase involved in cell wall biosynthesis